MGQKEKLIKRLKSRPKDFTFTELETLLAYLGFYRSNKGKTSGSRVEFASNIHNKTILIHRPHGQKELPGYAINRIVEVLEEAKLL